MLVYGDRRRTARPGELIADIERRLAALPPAGIARHAALVETFVACAELAQGLQDVHLADAGADGSFPAGDAATAAALVLAQGVVASWRGAAAPLPDLAALRATDLPAAVEPRTGEGYAFYALYPETYAQAAARSGLGPETVVVGLRSIGLGLACMVAAALGAPPPMSVRPVGHPFRRELRLSRAYEDRLRRAPAVAVVDEGPGLSGSSFQAVAAALALTGARPERVVYFPSHAGAPGAEADPAWLARWEGLERRLTGFDEAIAPRVTDWVADLTGAAAGPSKDISGGAWRALAGTDDEADWPPADSFREGRKFLLRSARGAWLLKFAGLGPQAGGKLERARALAQAGFTPELAGFRHGFLVERWIEGARRVAPEGGDRAALVAGIGRYLGFRARAFPAGSEAGASLADLLEMARVNAAEALGAQAGARLDRWTAGLPELERRVRRVFTDNRLHAWEWIVAPDGRLLKTDAVDHAEAHDMVGAQDIAWDLAGAWAEFGLSPEEEAQLAGAAGLRPDPGLLALMKPCYLAFQLGAFAMAADAHAGWPAEAARLRRRSDTYASLLSHL